MVDQRTTEKTRRRGHGEGSIFQRADGRWAASIDLGWQDGKRTRKTIYGATQKDVLAKMKTAVRERERGKDLSKPQQTLGVFTAQWLADIEAAGNLAPKTLDQYQRLTRLHIVPALGQVKLEKLTAADITRWLRVKHTGDPTPKSADDPTPKIKPLNPKTCSHLRGILRTILNAAKDADLIVRNPVDKTKPVAGESKPIQPLTTAEMTTFLATIRPVADADAPATETGQDRDRRRQQASDETLFRLTLSLGLRIGEALGLKWQDVDLDGSQPWAIGRPCLRIEWTLQRVTAPDKTSALLLKRPKTAKSRRVLPIPAPLIAALTVHKVRQTERRLLNADLWQDNGLVFATALGTGIDPRNALRSFHAACERAGIPRRRLHDLRHTAVTALLAQGVPLKVVSELLGHSQLATTSDLYGHVLSETLADATDRLAAAWGA